MKNRVMVVQVVIVSGGSSGIGKSCVEKFLQQGYYVYNLDIEDNQALAQQMNYACLITDIRHHQAIIEAVDKIMALHGRIDVLITSAGKHLSATIEQTSQQQLHDIVDLNMFGVFWLIQAVIPHMKNKQCGRIITIGSDQSVVGKRNSAAYGMTKAAILSLTKNIALDYASDNIRANCIGAGTIDTPLYRNAINQYAKKSGIAGDVIHQQEGREQPVGRIGKPEEVAELAFFLAQDAADYMTGALLPIDGGYIAQ